MRSIYVHGPCGCSMPGIAKALTREQFEKAADAQAARRRVRPAVTHVGRYVESRSPRLSRRIYKVLKKHAPLIAAKVAAASSPALTKAMSESEITQFIADALSDSQVDSLISEFGLEAMADEIRDSLASDVRQAFIDGGQLGVTQVGVANETALGSMTDQVDQAAVDFARTRGADLIKDLANTSLDNIRGVLSDAVDGGLSVDELASNILSLDSTFGDMRAEMIARTELAFAHVQGNVEGWRATGEVERKRSMLGDLHDVPDECDDCAEAGDVRLDDDFVDGLDFPPYHPNCVCAVMPLLADDAEPSDEGDDSGDDS